MADTVYEYSVSTDFSNGVAAAKLQSEIQQSAIVTAVSHIGVDGDTASIWFKAALSTGDKSVLDGLVAAHDGVAESSDPIVQDGVMYVAQVPGKPGRTMVITGRRFAGVIGGSANDDVSFEHTRELQGARVEVVSHAAGDYLEMFVCMPDGTPVGQFAEHVYIPPSGLIEQVVSEGTVGFPAGFLVRTVYHSVASTGEAPDVYVWYRFRRDPA